MYYGALYMNHRTGRAAPIVHACVVVVAYTAIIGWLFAFASVTDSLLSESDLFEYYLPIFLAPITVWSPFEFSGLPAFADPGDFGLYPLHFIFARLVGSWTGFIASAFVLAACFTYAYVYRVTRSWAAAAFAGLAYALSEAMIERMPHLGTLHAFVWLPLVLLSIEGLRGAHPRRWIAIGGLAVGCCILSGHPQPAVYTSYAALAYALVGGWAEAQPRRYYLSVLGIFVLGGILASVKLLPLVEASFLMARQIVSFGQFAAHGNTPAQMLSVLFPSVLHEGREAPTYVGLITLIFALAGATLARRHWRAGFWVAAAVIALLLGAGDSTPVAQIAYWIVPLYTKFRAVGRHLFLFALGASILAGFAIAAIECGEVSRRVMARAAGAVVVLVIAAALLLFLMPQAFQYEVRSPLPWSLPIWNAGVWVQFALTAASAAAIWLVSPGRATRGLALGTIGLLLVADTLYSLPYPLGATGIAHITIPADAVRPNVHAVEIAREMQPFHQRALSPGGTSRDDVLPAAFARLWRIPMAGAYGPMLLDRYSRLAMMGTNGSVRPTLLAREDTALDLLAVRFLIVRPDDVSPPPLFERDDVEWAAPRLSIPVGRPDCGHKYPRSISLPLPRDVTIASVAVVGHLGCSEHVAKGEEVASLAVVGHDGTLARMPLRAGHETAENSLFMPELRKRAKHQPARIFDDPDGDRAYVYGTTLTLPTPAQASYLEVTSAPTGGWYVVDRLTLVDSAGRSHPQSVPSVWLADPERWREVRRVRTSRTTDRGADADSPDEHEFIIVENLRALPRAWVVSNVIGLSEHDATETLRHSQLPDGRTFDPRTTAIVDAEALPPQTLFDPGDRSAEIVSLDDEQITLDVSSKGGGFLVVSDAWYPGWRARIDGRPVEVYRTNLALRGVVVPAGRHTVTFDFASTTMRAGTALSTCGVLALALMLFAPDRRYSGQALGAERT